MSGLAYLDRPRPYFLSHMMRVRPYLSCPLSLSVGLALSVVPCRFPRFHLRSTKRGCGTLDNTDAAAYPAQNSAIIVIRHLNFIVHACVLPRSCQLAPQQPIVVVVVSRLSIGLSTFVSLTHAIVNDPSFTFFPLQSDCFVGLQPRFNDCLTSLSSIL
jgi:hypothetical protein